MCYSPIRVFRYEKLNQNTGEVETKLLFHQYENDESFKKEKKEAFNASMKFIDFVNLPCGKCVECLKQKSLEWTYRLLNEFESCGRIGCFITLTYAEDPVSLVKRDLQLFLKRLRKKLSPLKIRYFASGEYGSKGLRPHYHLLIFGWKPDDLKFLKKTSKNQLIFTSKTLEALWPLGYSSVGEINNLTCKYSAKYLQKYNLIDENLVPPFITMSTHPGIGLKWFLDNDDILDTDKVYVNGKYIKVPRYYLKKSIIDHYDKIVKLKNARILKASLNAKTFDDLEYKKANIETKLLL